MIVRPTSPPTLGVIIRVGTEDGVALVIARPDPAWHRIDVVGYAVKRDGAYPTVVTGTPGWLLRIPPLPPRFVPLAWVIVEASQAVIQERSIWADPDPSWLRPGEG